MDFTSFATNAVFLFQSPFQGTTMYLRKAYIEYIASGNLLFDAGNSKPELCDPSRGPEGNAQRHPLHLQGQRLTALGVEQTLAGFPFRPLSGPRTPANCLILAAARTVPGTTIKARAPAILQGKEKPWSVNLLPRFTDEEIGPDK